MEAVEERIEGLEPALRGVVRALLVLVLDNDIRVWLTNHDRKAYRQAWDAIEQALPGALHYYRSRVGFCRDGGITVGLDGKVWRSDPESGTTELAGEFEEGTIELRWFKL